MEPSRETLSEWAETADTAPSAVIDHLPSIVDALDAESPETRNQAVIIISRIATESPDACLDFVSDLEDLLSDPNDVVQYNAGLALESIAAKHPAECAQAVPALIRGLASDNSDVRNQYRDVLAEMESDAGDQINNALEETILDASKRLQDEDIDSNTALIDLARIALAKPASLTPAVPHVTDYLIDEDNIHRYHAALVLRRIANEYPDMVTDGVSPLANRLVNDSDPDVREMVTKTLAAVADERPDAVIDVTEQVVAGLNDGEKDIADNCGSILRKLAASHPSTVSEYTTTLIEHIGDGGTVQDDIIAGVLLAIADSDSGDTEEVIRDYIEDSDRPVDEIYNSVVTKAGESDTAGPANPESLEGLVDIAASNPDTVLARLDDICGVLAQEGHEEQNIAARILASVANTSPEPVVEILQTTFEQLVGTSNEKVQYNLMLAVRRISSSHPRDVGERFDVLVELLDSNQNPDVRELVALALSDIANANPDVLVRKSFPAVVRGLQTDNDSTRHLTARTIAMVVEVAPGVGPEMVPDLVTCLDDSVASTRDWATRGLVAIAREYPDVVRTQAPKLASRLIKDGRGIGTLRGSIEYESLRGGTDELVGNRDCETCKFVYFGSTEIWGCPHQPASGDTCVFHRPVSETDDRQVRQKFLDAISSRGELSKEFFGATFGSLDISHEILDGPDNHPINLTGAVFDGASDWSGTTVRHEVYFDDAQFRGPVDFSQATFDAHVSFRHSVFVGDAHFTRLKINANGHFNSATFQSETEFDQSQFALDVFFTDARIEEKASFFRMTVGQSTHFDGGVIEGDADFGSASFDGNTTFAEASIEGHANFRKARFADGALFSEARFAEKVSFNRAHFAGPAMFTDAFVGGTFSSKGMKNDEELILREATIDGPLTLDRASINSINATNLECRDDLSFENANIESRINIDSATVGGDLIFKNAELKDTVAFLESTLSGTLQLKNARFGGGATFGTSDFEGAIQGKHTAFEGRTVFNSATVAGPVEFDKSVFEDEAHFSSATFESPVQIEGADFHTDVVFTFSEFRDSVSLEESIFEANVDISSAMFQQLSISDAEFMDSLRLYSTECSSIHALDIKVADDLNCRKLTVSGKTVFTGAAIAGRFDLTGAMFEDGADFRDLTVEIFALEDVSARDTLIFVGSAITEAEIAHVDLSPSKGFVDLARTEIQGGQLAVDGNPAIFDFTEATIGDLSLDGDEDIFDYLLFVGTEFEGFDFSRYKKELEAANWKIHETVEEVAPGNVDYGISDAADDLSELADAAETLSEIKSRREEESINTESRLDSALDEFASLRDDGRSLVDQLEAFTHRLSLKEDRAEVHGFRQDSLAPGRLENTYLKAKNGANAVGDNDAAAEFYLREMRYRRSKYVHLLRTDDSASSIRLGQKWIKNMLLDMSCGYGERPSRTVSVSGWIVLSFAVLYWLLGFDLPYAGLTGYLIFSLESFVALVLGTPATTNALTTSLVALESFLGGFVIALFVFALTRSINR